MLMRGMVFIWSAVLPGMAPSPACQPPLHSLQTALSLATFLLQGHIPIFNAQSSQGCFRHQAYLPAAVAFFLYS